MRAGSNQLEAASGTSARFTNGVISFAVSARNTKSQCSSIVVPTPTALPCTAATSGRVALPRLLMNRCAWGSPVSLPLAWALKSARSFPAVKLSPSPWNRTTRTAGSFSARSNPSDIALYMALLRAFFLSARASVNVMIPADSSVLTFSVMITLLLAAFVWSPSTRCYPCSLPPADRPLRACRPDSRISSDRFLSPTARASTIEPIMVASAPVAIWRASFGDFSGNKRATTSIISSSFLANIWRAFWPERAMSVPRAGSTHPFCPIITMTGPQICFNDNVETLLDRHSLRKLQPLGDRSIHGQGERLDHQSVARFEMRVEAPVRETRELHQIGYAQAVGAGLTQTTRGFFDNPAPGLQPMALHVAHRRLHRKSGKCLMAPRRIFISPFLGEWPKLGKE